MRNDFKAQEMNLLELAQVIVKRKVLIAKVCLAGMLLSIGYTLLLPNIYCATAKVLPPQKEVAGGISSLLGQTGGLTGLALGGLGGGADLYLGVLKSRSVSDAVIKKLDLMRVYKKKTIDETRQTLDKVVRAESGKDTIIAITVEDKDPKLAAQLANALVEELKKTTVRMNLSKAGTDRIFLDKRIEVVQKDLAAAEEDLKSFAQRNKIVQVDSQAKVSIEGIARLKADLAGKEVQLSVLRSNQTEQSPEVRALESATRRLKEELSHLSGANGFGEGIPSVGSMPAVALEYTRKMRELKTQEAIFEQLKKQSEMAKLAEAKDSSSLQVLDDAVVPIKKTKPKRSFMVILMTAGALFIGVFAAFLLEYLERLPDADRETLQAIKKYALTLK
jgi:uncharacterized protein involved in exopolysaccharide biosynthesis